MKAGPTANNMTGIDNSKVTNQVFEPKIENPDNPPTAMNPRARENAAVANTKFCFSISLNSHTCFN